MGKHPSGAPETARVTDRQHHRRIARSLMLHVLVWLVVMAFAGVALFALLGSGDRAGFAACVLVPAWSGIVAVHFQRRMGHAGRAS